MLRKETNVKEHADVAQSELHRVSYNPRPIMLAIRIDGELTEREHATTEVKQYLVDRPTARRLISMVGEKLWHIFENRYQKLNIGNGVNLSS